jgi:flagellar biosynthesis/type III secretory pathway M-ring protein FliF/YscJ
MGLKSGSRDAGLDDDDDPEEPPVEAEADDQSDATDGQSSAEQTAEADETGGGRPTMDSIPYKLRRDRVNDGRDQVPFFLREEVIDGEDELRDRLEEILGEDVYKSDYREAAMVVAQRKPELVAEVLREWGYDLE